MNVLRLNIRKGTVILGKYSCDSNEAMLRSFSHFPLPWLLKLCQVCRLSNFKSIKDTRNLLEHRLVLNVFPVP